MQHLVVLNPRDTNVVNQIMALAAWHFCTSNRTTSEKLGSVAEKGCISVNNRRSRSAIATFPPRSSNQIDASGTR